jgi:two-component system osmolarity sensor histidine kinase EnvZ
MMRLDVPVFLIWDPSPEAASGSGLGLAIVSDLAELNGGTISLEDSPIGGLRARLQLPA